MAINLRVTPDVLTSEAGAITDKIGKIETNLQTINEQIRSSKNYWEGDASDVHQERYRKIEDEAKKIIKRLKRNPQHLLEMAGLYKSTESKNQALSQKLPSNLIQ